MTGVSTNFVSAIGIQSGGTVIGAGITQLNFIGAGNTFAVSWNNCGCQYSRWWWRRWFWCIHYIYYWYSNNITNRWYWNYFSTDDADLQGIGNSAKGMYVSNGMMIMDNAVSGNHYIGTNFNGLMVGPVNINGTISIDGNYVVV